MSADSEPITPARFAAALPALAISSLHAKAAELYNSIAHLRSSNIELAPFSDKNTSLYDDVCAQAFEENETVMERMQERISLLKREVEGRGALWVWDSLDKDDGEENEARVVPVAVNGHLEVDGANAGSGDAQNVSGAGGGRSSNGNVNVNVTGNSNSAQQATQAQSGRFTDEELARRIMEQMDNDNSENDGGMHL